MVSNVARPVWPHRAQWAPANRVPGRAARIARELKGRGFVSNAAISWEVKMGRGILLWLLGVPIPVIILLALLWR
jgi:hypothetical protein